MHHGLAPELVPGYREHTFGGRDRGCLPAGLECRQRRARRTRARTTALDRAADMIRIAATLVLITASLAAFGSMIIHATTRENPETRERARAWRAAGLTAVGIAVVAAVVRLLT
ncbi:hypothetical protein GCM10023113_03710 [Cellulomonas oligotrophica]|uniref:HIG1 domain-containing protein n=1 Tax=Cellulomonas oligotrophica TaxID=931536 RepID=A0ABQ4DA17_9CELL|nr:hypothetical protein Col01nite_17300 [Cellulomonas oligotrophica]